MDSQLEEALSRAGTACANGNYQHALDAYFEALDSWPSNGVVRANLSALLLRVGRVEEAVLHAEKAVELCPQWPKAHSRLGDSLRAMGEVRGSLVSLCHSLCLDDVSSSLSSLFSSASIAFPDSFPLSALRGSGLDENPSAVIVSIGQCFLLEGWTKEAVSVLSSAHSLPPPSVPVHLSLLSSLSSALSASGEHSRSLTVAREHLLLCRQLGLPLLPSPLTVPSALPLSDALDSIARECLSLGDGEGAVEARIEILNTFHEVSRKGGREEGRKGGGELKGAEGRATQLLVVADLCLSLHRGEQASTYYSAVLMETEEEEERRTARTGLACCLALGGDSDKAVQLLEDIEVNCPEEHLRVRILEWKSVALLKGGRLDPSPVLRFLDHHPDQVSVFGPILSRHFLSSRQFGEASKWAKRSLAAARRVEDHALEVSSLFLLSQILDHCDKAEPAVKILLRVSEMAEAGRGERMAALDRAAALLESMGEVEEAEATRRKAEAMEGRGGRGRKGMEEKSVQRLEEALAEAQEAGDEAAEVRICLQLGRAHEEDGKVQSAMHYVQQALAVARELRLVRLIGEAYSLMGGLWSVEGEWGRASGCGRAALEMARLARDKEAETKALHSIATAEERKGNNAIARAILHKMMTRKGRKKEGETRIRAQLAELAAKEGMREEAECQWAWLFRGSSGWKERMDWSCRVGRGRRDEGGGLFFVAALKEALGVEERKAEGLVHFLREARDCIDTALSSYAVHLLLEVDASRVPDLLHSLPQHHQLPFILLLLERGIVVEDNLPLLFPSLAELSLLLPSTSRSQSPIRRLLSKMEEKNEGEGVVAALSREIVDAFLEGRPHSVLRLFEEVVVEVGKMPLGPSLHSVSLSTVVAALSADSLPSLLSILLFGHSITTGIPTSTVNALPLPPLPFNIFFHFHSIQLCWECRAVDKWSLSFTRPLAPMEEGEEELQSLLSMEGEERSPLPVPTTIGLPLLRPPSSPPVHCSFSLSPPLSSLLSPPFSRLLLLDVFVPDVVAVSIDSHSKVSPVVVARKLLQSCVAVIGSRGGVNRGLGPLLLSPSFAPLRGEYDGDPVPVHVQEGSAGESPRLVVVVEEGGKSKEGLLSLVASLHHVGTPSIVLLPQSAIESVPSIVEEVLRGSSCLLPPLLPWGSLLVGEERVEVSPPIAPSLRESLGGPSSSLLEKETAQLVATISPSTLQSLLSLPEDTSTINEEYERLKGGEGEASPVARLARLFYADHLLLVLDPFTPLHIAASPSVDMVMEGLGEGAGDVSLSSVADERGYVSGGEGPPSEGRYSVGAVTRSRRRGKEGQRRRSASARCNRNT